MAFQFSTLARNNWLDSIETTVGPSPILRILTGAAPVNCAAAQTGTVLAELTPPADFLAAASNGSKTLLGTWRDVAANATGTAGHFRLYDAGGTTCHIQGSITATGDGGDMQVSSTAIVAGGQIDITAFTLNAGGA